MKRKPKVCCIVMQTLFGDVETCTAPLLYLSDAVNRLAVSAELDQCNSLPSAHHMHHIPVADPPSSAEAPSTSSVSTEGLFKKYHLNPSTCYPISGPGFGNLLQQIDREDHLRDERKIAGPYYPFASKAEWKLAKWLTEASLPQTEIDKFLRLDFVRPCLPAFKSNHD